MVGISSNPTTVTLVNTGNSSLNITGISNSGSASSDFSQTNNCGSLSAGGSCAVMVTFTPTAAGSRMASLLISDTAPGSPQSVSLVGTGIARPDFSMNPASGSPTSQTITAGQKASFSVAIAPMDSFTGTVNLSCAIAPAVTPAPTCTLSSSSVQISGSGTQSLTVKVETTAPVITSAVFHVNFPLGLAALAWTLMALISTWLWLRGHSRLPALVTPVMLLAFVFSVGCGGSGAPPTHTTPGTPSGTYTVTIAGSSASLNHSIALQVVVQ
jgi:hypothetical protein